MSLWYTFKLSLKLGVLAKNGMRKNARVTSFAYLYNARHLLSDIFLKAKEGDTKKVVQQQQSSVHISVSPVAFINLRRDEK